MSSEPIPFLSDYLRHLRMRDLSPATVQRHELSLSNFARFIAPATLLDADVQLVEDWLSRFRAARTKHAYRSDLASFMEWAKRRKLIADSPMDDVGKIRIPKQLPHPVPAEHVEFIIATAPTRKLRYGFALAAYAGLRCAEAATLQPADVSLEAGIIAVRHGKGAKDRVVPMHPRLRTILASHTSAAAYVGLTPDYLSQAASRHLHSLDLPYTLHNLRATFATELARVTNGNLLLVGQALGHESPVTTKGYVLVALAGGPDLSSAVGKMFDQAA